MWVDPWGEPTARAASGGPGQSERPVSVRLARLLRRPRWGRGAHVQAVQLQQPHGVRRGPPAAAAAQGTTHQIGHVSGIYMLRSACEVAGEAMSPDASATASGSDQPTTPGLRRLAVAKSDAAAAHAARVAWTKLASSRGARQGTDGAGSSRQSSMGAKPVDTPELLWCMVHHQTNSWRWKARRDDAVRLLDSGMAGFAVVVVLVGVLGVFAGGLCRFLSRRLRACIAERKMTPKVSRKHKFSI